MKLDARIGSLLALCLLPLLVLQKALLKGEALGPFDQIRQMAPWGGPRPTQPWDVLPADGVLQFYPWRDLVLTSWGQGVVPMWNPYVLAGTPLLANSQSGALYPPHILLGLLHVPTALAMVLLVWAHLALAGLGTHALVRRLGGTDAGAAAAGAIFALSPFMVSWTMLPSVISTVAWIPWGLAAIVATFWHRTDEKKPWSFAVLPIVVAMMLLAGHLQFAAYGLMAIALVGLCVLAGHPDGSRLTKAKVGPSVVRSGLGIVLGVLIAAPHLLPVLQYGQFSHRRNAPTDEGYTAYIASALRPTDFLSRLANPFGQGDPTDSFAENSPESTFWPALSRQGANFAESATTIGPACILLLALMFLYRPRLQLMVPVLVLAVFAGLMAGGTPLNRIFYFYAPGWSASGSPGRIVCLFVLAMAVLAGLAVPCADHDPVGAPPDKKADSRRLIILALVALVLIAATFLPIADPAPNGAPADAWATLINASGRKLIPFLLSVVLAGILVAGFARPTVRFPAIGLILAVILSTLATDLPSLVRSSDPTFLKSNPLSLPPQNRVAFVNSAWGITQAAPALYPPNTAIPLRIHDLGGYDSLLHRDTQAMLASLDGGDPAPPANGNMMFIKPGATLDGLKDAGVTEVFSRKEVPQLGNYTNAVGGLYRYVLDGPGRASTPIGPATIESENLQTLTLSATGPGILTLRDRKMDGWIAKVDGAHVPIGGTRWREVNLPAGNHRVQFSYVPPGFMPGVFAAAFGLLALTIMTTLDTRRTRTRTQII